MTAAIQHTARAVARHILVKKVLEIANLERLASQKRKSPCPFQPHNCCTPPISATCHQRVISTSLQIIATSISSVVKSLPVNLSVWSTLQRWSKWTTCQEGPMKFRFRQIEQQPAPRLDVVHREGRSLQSEQLNGNSTETGLNRPQDIPSFHQQF